MNFFLSTILILIICVTIINATSFNDEDYDFSSPNIKIIPLSQEYKLRQAELAKEHDSYIQRINEIANKLKELEEKPKSSESFFNIFW